MYKEARFRDNRGQSSNLFTICEGKAYCQGVSDSIAMP